MMTSRAFLKRHMVIGAMLAVVAAAGCGTAAEPNADASASNAEDAASPSPTSDAASTALPSPASGTSEASDADDADYESCGDGECEVSFSDSVEFPVGGPDGEWTVEAVVEDDGVKVSLTDPNGMGGGGGLLYQPVCTLEIRADGGGGLSCVDAGQEPPEPEAGGFVVHLLELSGNTALIQVHFG
ncbi:hypothetical protein K3N28_22930 [Glycomyces sp. TRM65418]|uniref:hypothetical protein n=1 Tax=Glycomyces sp. TRM65418 TaxID=2867006 RepID=UPI001CE53707|nr:hypothetical protein [Glycomyces sp. TRM65418]MCC3765918.1 hypothetical protein [Glycomyces sp. TRM65418]QZD55500.1 hypothetical protein K3N28_22805 [Glycomyces sp. TRM65418]